MLCVLRWLSGCWDQGSSGDVHERMLAQPFQARVILKRKSTIFVGTLCIGPGMLKGGPGGGQL